MKTIVSLLLATMVVVWLLPCCGDDDDDNDDNDVDDDNDDVDDDADYSGLHQICEDYCTKAMECMSADEFEMFYDSWDQCVEEYYEDALISTGGMACELYCNCDGSCEDFLDCQDKCFS
ncbi:MAG TPA: hypothetical protein PKW95_02180 [bacterium]|nr:hypothetical protein [bacterium]